MYFFWLSEWILWITSDSRSVSLTKLLQLTSLAQKTAPARLKNCTDSLRSLKNCSNSLHSLKKLLRFPTFVKKTAPAHFARSKKLLQLTSVTSLAQKTALTRFAHLINCFSSLRSLKKKHTSTVSKNHKLASLTKKLL